MALFPSLIIQQRVNPLSTRHTQPAGPGRFDFVWTRFALTDDGEVIEDVQQAFEANPGAHTVSELDGRDVQPAEHMANETLTRGMHGYRREGTER